MVKAAETEVPAFAPLTAEVPLIAGAPVNIADAAPKQDEEIPRNDRPLGYLDHLCHYWLFIWEGVLLGNRIFRSNTALSREKRRHLEADRYIIHPFSRFMVLWDSVMLSLMIISAVIFPVQFAFYLDDLWSTCWTLVNLFLDFIFLADVAVNLRAALIVDNQVILDRNFIQMYYTKSWFIVDFMTAFPLDYIVRAFGKSAGLKIAAGILMFLKSWRLLRFRYISRIRERIQLSPANIRMMILLGVIVIYLHWIACLHYFVPAMMGFPPDSWVALNDLTPAQRGSVVECYVQAMFRSLSCMISNGYGQGYPVNNTDTAVTLVSMLGGATLYVTFIANMSSWIMSRNYADRKYDQVLSEVKEYLIHHRVPSKIQGRVFDFFKHRYSNKMFDEQMVLEGSSMPYPLKSQILLHNCHSLISRVPFLADAPQSFTVDIIAKLKKQVFFPGDTIVKAGETGDEMYFIEHGRVDIIHPNIGFVQSLSDGANFGEISLVQNEKRVASVMATELSDIYILTNSDFQEVLKAHPSMRSRIEAQAQKRLEKIQEMSSCHKKPRPSYQNPQHGVTRDSITSEFEGSLLNNQIFCHGADPETHGSASPLPDVQS